MRFLIIFFALNFTLLPTSAQFCEQTGQFHFKSSCYTLTNAHIEWLDGVAECRAIRSDYLIIETLNEFNFIKNHVKKLDNYPSRSYYIGAEDQLRRGFLKWLRTENKVPDKFLCNTTSIELNSTVHRMKLCAVIDQDKLCIDGRNCTFAFPVICETNCTKPAFFKTKMCQDRENKKKTKNQTIFKTTELIPTTTTTIQISLLETTSLQIQNTTSTISTSPLLASTTSRDASCDENSCENNSTCIPFTSIANNNYLSKHQPYLCECELGFGGDLCEKDLRPCSNYVCINNSTCESTIHDPMDFKCKCQTNFEGLFCETNTFCNNVTCLNNGNCIADYNNYTCYCPSYFQGRHCEIKDSDLVVLENVSASISVAGIVSILMWGLFIFLMDISRFLFKIEPDDLFKQRELLKQKKLLKRIRKLKRRLISRYNKLNQKKLRFKHECSHFSIKNVKYIDEDSFVENSEEGSQILNRNKYFKFYMNENKITTYL